MNRSFDTVQDELLVLAAQAGDIEAFEALVRRWLPVMRRHAARLTVDPAAAEDVTQDACLAICHGLRTLADPASAHGWMLRIVTHKAVDWVRRRQRDRELTQSVRNREPRPAPSDFSREAEALDRSALIRAACRELPADLRAVVSLYYGEGLSISAVAAGTGTPEGTVKSRLHEARTQLRSILERTPS
jgi:RNA polymerase sigma-70 factor (ECF subfamily)